MPCKRHIRWPKVSEDGSVESIDYKKCAVPFSKNKGCTVCVKECTFFDNDYDKIKSNFIKMSKA